MVTIPALVSSLGIAACLLLSGVATAIAAPDQWTVVDVERPGELLAAKAFTRFRLTKDIHAEASGLEIVPAPGVTGDLLIDLNGHTLSFANGQRPLPEGQTFMTYTGLFPASGPQSRNVGHFGIFYCRDPRLAPHGRRFSPAQWGPVLKRVAIVSSRPGGRIVQGDGGASFGAGILLQGVEEVTVSGAEPSGGRNLLVEVHGPDFFGIDCGGSSRVTVSGLTIRHRGRVVSNRHAIVAALKLGPGQEAPEKRSTASGLDIVGSPQAGIVTQGNALIHGCRISQDVTVANGYGIQGWKARNVEVADNRIAPLNGRGIHLSEGSSGWNVHGNTVVVRETPPSEYPARYLTHGIKLEKTTDSRVRGNLVIARTGPKTAAHALDVAVESGSRNEISGNTFVAVNTGDAPPAMAKSLVFMFDGGGVTLSNNRFLSNQCLIFPSETGAVNYVIRGNSFERLETPAAPAPFMTTCFVAWKKPRASLRLVDNVFTGGASATDVWIKPFHVARDELAVANTLEVLVRDDGGRPLPLARVRAVDASGHGAEAVTDAHGRASLVLDVATYLMEGVASPSPAAPEPGIGRFKGTVLTPHEVTVAAPGSSPVTFSAQMDRPRRFVATLGPSGRIEERAAEPENLPPAFDLRLLEK